jgi:phage protein D
MLTPAYRLTFGGRVVDTTLAARTAAVVALEVVLDLDVPADAFTLVFGEAGGVQPARGDELGIELGYADGGELVRVFTGSVVAVEPGLETTRVVGLSPAHALLRAFVEETFEATSAGAIARELADRAGVEVARAEDGISLPAYVVDGRRSAWRHLRDLADLSGFDLYLDPDGDLVFEAFAGGQTVHRFEHARDLLALEAVAEPPRAGTVEAWGEGPGAGRGDGSWAWLTKDFAGSRGAAGSDGPTLLLERPALRTAAAAATAARSAQAALARRAFRGRLAALGRPEVRLGDALRLRELPRESLNELFQVRRVVHRMDKLRGFTTSVDFRTFP